MKLKKIACTILSFVCMFFLGIGIFLQNPVQTQQAKAESPTVTVAINQNANNVDWDATQKRILLDVVDKTTGTTAFFTAWESITSVIGNGVTMNGTGANLNFFGSTGDGVSVIYPSSLEEGTVFSIAEGTVINGYVFPEFTVSLVNGKWVKEPTVTVEINQGANNADWDATQKRVLLNVVDKATGTTASFTAWESITSVIGNGVTMNGTGANLNFFGSTGDGVSVIYPSSLEDGAVFNIALGTEANGNVFPEFTLYLVNGKWQTEKPVAESVTVTNIHNRKGSDQRLLLFLSNSNYATNNADITAKIANLNVLDYVNVYTSKTEYKTLREIYQGNAQAKIWGEANSVGFQVDANYHGTAVYAVEIKAGAQFPSNANDYDTYVVSADVTYYNNSYQSSDAATEGWAVSWTTVKPVEPETPELGTPDVSFTSVHNDNNNSVWGGTTRAVRLVFSQNFTAKAYDGNDGGFDAPTIAAVRNFTKINGQSLGNVTFLQVENENSITFLYDESLLAVPAGQDYTTFTIEAGAPFGGHYLPAVTLYLVNGQWRANKPVAESVTITNIHNRAGSDQRLLLFLSNSNYATNNADITAKIASLNVLDYVNVYTSATEYKTLREIYQGNAQAKIWGEANSVGFQVDANYHGTAVYAVEIKAGAQFPSSANDYDTYVVSADITYYNNSYQSTDTNANGWAISWTTVKPVEPEEPVLGTPDVEFVEVYAGNNNSVWGGATRAIRLTFSKNFTAKAYDANEGGFDAPVIANVRNFTKINGQSLGNFSFLQVDNENSITFLYDESLLTVPAGQDYTTFTIEAGAPFGGHYLPAVTLYLVDGVWCENKPVTESVTITNIHNRAGSGQKILLFLSESDYEASNTDITAKVARTNVLDNVYVYTSETEYKTLREIYQGNAQAKIWGEANSVGFAVNASYHGTAVYSIVIKAGAQFPAVANDYTTYVVSEDVAFYNMDYKSTDAGKNDFATAWGSMFAVTLKGELATGETSAKLYVVPGNTFAYPEAYSKTQAGDENTIYIYNWYLDGNLYNFNTTVTEDITLTADGTFTAYFSYNVTFDDGKTQNTVIVGEGQTVAEPDAPTKADTAEYRYAFSGWYNGETKWDFSTPITENLTLTAKFDQVKKIVLSDLYVEGKASEAIKTGEIKITKSGDHYKGYVGSNLYFDLSLELSYTQTVELATFDVKMTNATYAEANTSPFYLSWHVYYQRPANTLCIEYHKYNKDTGARETLTAAVSEVALSAGTIYQANFAYRVIDEATGLVELYSNIAGWENTLTHELGAEYLATATGYDCIAFATEGSVPEMDITFADPGLTGAAHYDVTFKDGDATIMTDMSNQIQLPTIESEFVEGGLSKVFVGWTTDISTLTDLYPAGYKFKLAEATQLYAVWIEFEMQDGAAVRTTANSSGIRFLVDIAADSYYYLDDTGVYVSLGTLIAPTDYLSKVEAFEHNKFPSAQYYLDIPTNEKWRVQEGDVWTYAAAAVKIQKYQYSRSMSARGYVQISYRSEDGSYLENGYVYTPYSEDLHARSIYEVATAAYNDTENNYKNHTVILEYVNSVADITLSSEMGLAKAETAVGDYTLESDLANKTFSVSFSRDINSAMINGTRISDTVAKNVQIGNFIFSIKDVTIDGSKLSFTVDAASELDDKYSDDNTYFRSSDSDLDFFLNDYFTRHATGMYENGKDQTVNSVVAGKSSEEFFWWEWFSTAYYTMDTNSGFDRIEGLREKLSNVPVDDYGYVWQNTDVVRDAKSTLASAEHRMGWPFPTANEMVVIEAVRTSLWSSATTNYITKGYSTSWDFNGGDRTAWSSNVNATLDGAGLFKGTANGSNKVTFSSPTLPKTHTVKKYSGISSSNITVYDEPAIYTYYAPLLELDVRMSNADNVKDIVVYFKTNEGGSTEYSMSVNDYAFIKYDYSGKYEHMLFLPMYAHENWGDSETRYVTDLRIEIIPEDGKTLSGDFALSYVRPSLDTRHTNNNSIFISSLRQDYDYTGDLAFLEQNITRARKAMNFLMQFYDAEKGLMDSSYLVGHDADKTGSNIAERTAHSLGNGYWDISYMPKYDFHSNSYFYKAVADMAYLESILAESGSTYASDAVKAEANVQTAGRISNDTLGKGFAESNYSALDLSATATNTLNAIRATTNNFGFWDSTKGRFVAGYGDADANGSSEWVDYGYLVWNLEAIYYGIATEEQAELIMQWVTGERTVAGDTSTGEDIYFFQLAPRATTYQGSSATDSSVYTGVWHGTNNGGEFGESQVQHGGAIMYTSYYDLMNRIAVNGADDAYTRLNAIKDWYMDVYAYYQTSGSTPDDFYWDYYENSQWDSNGDGKGEYWKLQNGIKGQAERDGFTGGVIGIDGEFLESFLPVAAIPYGFFGVESLGNGTLQIAPKLPGDLDYWTAENLTFGGCKYDVTIYENALQISAVRGEIAGLKLKVALNAPASDYKVYVNGFATTDFEVVNGQIIVELAFGNAIVEIR